MSLKETKSLSDATFSPKASSIPKHDQNQSFTSSNSSESELTNTGLSFHAHFDQIRNNIRSNEIDTVDMKVSQKKSRKPKTENGGKLPNNLTLPPSLSTLAPSIQSLPGLPLFPSFSNASTPTVKDLFIQSPNFSPTPNMSPRTPSTQVLSGKKLNRKEKGDSKLVEKGKNKKTKASKSTSKTTSALKVKPVLKKSLSAPVVSTFDAKKEGSSKEEFFQSLPFFIQKVYEMVSNDKNNLIGWSSSGESFFIYNREKFAKECIPKHFKHNNFSSFVRQMNFYGFRKVKQNSQNLGPNDVVWEFKNRYFQRDQPHLLIFIKRGHTEVERMIKAEEEELAQQGLTTEKISLTRVPPPQEEEEEVDELNMSTHPSIAHLQNKPPHPPKKKPANHKSKKTIDKKTIDKKTIAKKTINNNNKKNHNKNHDNQKQNSLMKELRNNILNKEIHSVRERLDGMATRLMQIKDLNCKKSPQIENLLVELIEEVKTIKTQNQKLESITERPSLMNRIEDKIKINTPQDNQALYLMEEFISNAGSKKTQMLTDNMELNGATFNKVQDDISTISSNYSSSNESSKNGSSDITSPTNLLIQNEIIPEESNLHRSSTQLGLISASAFSNPDDIVESLKDDKEDENVYGNIFFPLNDSMYIHQSQHIENEDISTTIEQKPRSDTISSAVSITNDWMEDADIN